MRECYNNQLEVSKVLLKAWYSFNWWLLIFNEKYYTFECGGCLCMWVRLWWGIKEGSLHQYTCVFFLYKQKLCVCFLFFNCVTSHRRKSLQGKGQYFHIFKATRVLAHKIYLNVRQKNHTSCICTEKTTTTKTNKQAETNLV